MLRCVRTAGSRGEGSSFSGRFQFLDRSGCERALICAARAHARALALNVALRWKSIFCRLVEFTLVIGAAAYDVAAWCSGTPRERRPITGLPLAQARVTPSMNRSRSLIASI